MSVACVDQVMAGKVIRRRGRQSVVRQTPVMSVAVSLTVIHLSSRHESLTASSSSSDSRGEGRVVASIANNDE